jgi:hypothetical protein
VIVLPSAGRDGHVLATRLGDAPNRGFKAGIDARIWRKAESSFFLLQASDFPQNGQRNLWKYLENGAPDLEMFGSSLEKPERDVSKRESRLPLVWIASPSFAVTAKCGSIQKQHALVVKI